MSSKWQVIVLGVVIVQGASLGAMENKATNSPRNALACSTEVRKEAATVEALKRSLERKNSSELSKDTKEALANTYFPYCSGGNPEYYWSSNTSVSDRMKPWIPDYFPGH